MTADSCTRTSCIILTALLLAIGCSSGGDLTQPLIPDQPGTSSTELTGDYAVSSGHNLWAYFTACVDPSSMGVELLPGREVVTHWNVLSWLENGPCTDCFKITSFVPSGSGTFLIDVRIRHLFSTPNLTGFDVRGIAMFDGSRYFAQSYLNTPDRSLGDGELVNADGYTTLYNYSTEGGGPNGMQGYIQGKFASWTPPNALLNGYKRHVSDDPANVRNAFYAGDPVTVTYEIDMPDDWFVFGYAVDANWAPPIHKPVTDPMNDFGPNANCAEPWKIAVAEEPIGNGLTHEGGQTKLIIDVYDWQGKDSHSDPVLECLELFYGTVAATWVEDGDGYSRYEATIENENMYPGGICKCLISVEDNENASAPEWLDLTAYQIRHLTVTGPPVARADAHPNPQSANDPVRFFDDGSYDPDGGDIIFWEWDWNNDGAYDETGEEAYQSWATPGTYPVQLRVTDDEGLTGELNYPLQITITEEGVPAYPTDITPADLNHFPYNVCIDGNYAYVASYYNGLEIFDVSNPSSPVWVTKVDPHCMVYDVAVQGDYAYVGAQYCGLLIVDINPPESAHIVNTVVGMGISDLFIDGGYAYSVYQNFGMDITDIDPPESAHVIKHIEYPGMYPYAEDISVRNGYACIPCSFEGILIYDVDPPGATHLVRTIENDWGCANGATTSGDYAYVADANFGLEIIDMTVPESAHIVRKVNMNGFAHDVVVSGSLAYVATDRWGLTIIDITTPESAHVVTQVDTADFAWGIDVSSGYACIADLSGGLQMIDVEPVGSASIVGSVDTPASARDIAYTPGYAYIAHELGLKIVDTDPYESAGIVHTVEGLYGFDSVDVAGGYAYAVDGAGNVNIIDITPPTSAGIVRSVPLTNARDSDISVSDGYAYVALIEQDSPEQISSFDIIDIDPPTSAFLAKTIDITGLATDIAASGGYAYLTVIEGTAPYETGSLKIIAADPPATAYIVKSVDTPGPALGVDVSGDYAYVGGDDDGLHIIDISTPSAAEIVNSVQFYGETVRLTVADGYAYVSAGFLHVIDVDPPESAEVLCYVDFPVYPQGIEIFNGYGYMAAGATGLRILKLW